MAGGVDKGTRADQPAAGGAQRWDRWSVGWPVVFLHTPRTECPPGTDYYSFPALFSVPQGQKITLSIYEC